MFVLRHGMPTAVCLAVLFGSPIFADIKLTENGKTAYRIVLPSDASDNLKYAAHELKIHLEEAAGTKFSVVKGTPEKNGKLIILREQDPKLKTGEFLIRTEGNRLLLSGGGESGIHHAVHDFLETDCGYIWYDARGGKKVPDLKNFKLKETDRKIKELSTRFGSTTGHIIEGLMAPAAFTIFALLATFALSPTRV